MGMAGGYGHVPDLPGHSTDAGEVAKGIVHGQLSFGGQRVN